MNNLFIKVSRAFFLLAVVSVMVAVFGFEIALLNSRRSGLVLGNESTVDNSIVSVLSSDSSGNVDGGVVAALVQADDARPLIIKRYLEKYKSPLVPYSDLIFKLSQTYGFEYYWIVAIAQQESNLCKKIPEGSHNCWGYGINSAGTLKFESYELALKSYAEYLKREYFDKGRMTSTQIMQKYCPHSNGSWARGVQQFIDDMESGDF